MATTWIKAVHRTNSGSISAAIKRTIEYAENADKTDGGELISAYECDPFTVQSEFMLSKKLYEQKTGRNQGKHDVIGYQIRQSFKPGEVTAEEALKIGHELAMRWTRGKHQFIVAAHTNTNSPHTHIFFNSVTLDHSRKFADFKRSAIALRRVSDKLCVEYGLSIVENPKLSKGHNRIEYLSGGQTLSIRDRLKILIDKSLLCGMSFEDFIAAMTAAGCEVKRGEYLAFKLPEGKKFIRCKSLGDDYTEDAILERFSGKRIIEKKSIPTSYYTEKSTPAKNENVPDLLINIEQKLAEGKGRGYEHWARRFNITQMSKTLLFIKEKGIGSYEELCEKCNEVSADYNSRNERRKEIDKRMDEVSELQKRIGTYGKSRDIYKQYLASGCDADFCEANRANITLHEAAKRYFDSLGYDKNKKLPTIAELKQEWAALLAEKKKVCANFKERREEMVSLLTARDNAAKILFGTQTSPQKSHEHDTL